MYYLKILLINPINHSYVIMPSLGLGYLAAVIRGDGHLVSILNCVKEQVTFDDFAALIKREQYDVIGFQVFTYDLNPVKKHLEIIDNVSPESITIAGGPHPSGDPQGTLTYLDRLNFAFQGEAETGLPLLLKKLAGENVEYATIPGLIWRDSGVIRENPPCFVDNLDALPMPAWDLLVPETYPEAPHGAFTRAFPTAPIIITRGCSSACTFCAGKMINGHRIRRRSLSNVIDELRCLAARGILEFHIEDENFTASPDYVLEFCQHLIDERLGMSWSLPSGVRLDTLTREVVMAMSSAGCYSLAVGIEFGSDRLLRHTGKGITLDQIRRKMQCLFRSGIKVTGFFMFGIPGETITEMKETINFALELQLDRAQFNNFIPLPGSIEWERLDNAGKLVDLNWDRFFVHDVAYVDAAFTAAELKRIQRLAILKFYLRPRILIGIIQEIRSIRHLKYLLKRLINVLA